MFLLPLNSRGRGHGNQGFKAGSEEEITAPPHHLLNALKKKKSNPNVDFTSETKACVDDP